MFAKQYYKKISNLLNKEKNDNNEEEIDLWKKELKYEDIKFDENDIERKNNFGKQINLESKRDPTLVTAKNSIKKVSKKWIVQISSKEYWFKQKYCVIFFSFVQVVILIASLIVGGGFASIEVNPLLGPKKLGLILVGAKDTPKIREGEYYRLITAIFCHVGIVHLFLNVFFQLRTGLDIENSIGSLRTFITYMTSGIGGNLASAVFIPENISVGASGALFGFLGLMCGDAIKNSLCYPKSRLLILLIVVFVNIVIGVFLPFVDNYCHLGGCIFGFFISLALLPEAKKKKNEQDVFKYSYGSFRNLIFIFFGIAGVVALFSVLGTLLIHFDSPNQYCSFCTLLNCGIDWSICTKKLYVTA